MLTFGVSTPIMYGTIMPVHDPMPFAMPVIVPEKFGLKSMGLTIVLAV